MRDWRLFYVGACVLAALAPWLWSGATPGVAAPSARDFPGWPTHFEGRELRRLPLSEREERFGGEFPGLVARFTDGGREIIFRHVTEPTRRLHPASDCFAGLGYQTRPLPLHVDGTGARWGSFGAERGGDRLLVRERIYSDPGGSWPDVSSWYWAAASGADRGPWWAVTVAERQETVNSRQ